MGEKIKNMALFFMVIITFSLLYHLIQREDELNQTQEKLFDLEYDKFILSSTLYFYERMGDHNVTVTAYTARPQETNNDPGNTSLMEKPIPGWTIATSRDLSYMKGKRVWVEGHGVKKVNDTMNIRYEERIDVLVGNVQQAREIGIQEDVNVVLIEPYLLVYDLIEELKEENFCVYLR